MDINDFMYDDEDVILNDDQKNQDDDQQQDDSPQNEEESVIETFLKGQGIQDIHGIDTSVQIASTLYVIFP